MENANHDSLVALSAKKDISIQALRGLAVILMVAGHVIGSASSRGMNVGDDSLWRYFYLFLEDIRMPLFTVISGYVYAIRPVRDKASVLGLARGKSRRLLVPLVSVGALLFLMQTVIPGTNASPRLGDFWRVFVYGYDHLWFLQSIFLIFVVVGLLDGFGMLSSVRLWMAWASLSAVVFILLRLASEWNLFSVNGAIRLLPFFLLGYGICRFRLLDLRGRSATLVFAVFSVFYVLRIAEIFGAWNPPTTVVRTLSLAVGLVGIVLIYSIRHLLNFRFLSWIGGFSFGIYLLHVFGSAASRIVMERFGVSSEVATFAVGLSVGIGAPIVFQLTAGRWGPVRRVILGEK